MWSTEICRLPTFQPSRSLPPPQPQQIVPLGGWLGWTGQSTLTWTFQMAFWIGRPSPWCSLISSHHLLLLRFASRQRRSRKRTVP